MRLVFLFFCTLLFTFTLSAQVQGKKIKSTAEGYFAKEKYIEALNLYQKYQRITPGDETIFSPLGIAYYHTGNFEEALRFLKRVVNNSKKPENIDIFYLARAYHMNGLYAEAATMYKGYLANVDDNDYRRRMVKDMIRRCGSGLNLIGAEELAIVENLGEAVNAKEDELAPLLSPNYDNKLYFSASRFGNTGGMRDDEGKVDELYGSFRTDMFSTYEQGGKWTVPEPMPNLLNSSRNDVILDFTQNGQVMFFFKGNDLVSGELLVDTFNSQSQSLFSKSFNGPLDPQQGDISLHFYNDSILIFASRKAGGFGGLDLYISTYNNGVWSPSKNLGPKINTPYDETTPFLAKDGRTIYFSSNNPGSIGGLDVFMSRYRDDQEDWTTAINLASPINSPGDDAYFKISPNGLKAFFSSERKGGQGGTDIYVAYFKKERQDNLVRSRPITFDKVTAYRRAQRDAGVLLNQSAIVNPTAATTNSGGGIPAKSFKFRPIYINQNDQVLGPGNIQELDKISQFLIGYPGSAIVLRGHGDGNSPEAFKLYFSIKRAEKAAEYIISKGANPKQIYLQGFGDQYPIIKMRTESGPQINASKFNRRIDYEFLGIENLPIAIEMEKPKVRDNYLDDKGLNLYSSMEGLAYRIQVAAINQNYLIPSNLNDNNWLVEKSGNFDGYRYQVGSFNRYSDALKLKNQIVGSGIAGAFVVPYLNGIPLKRSDAILLVEQYNDLQFYLSDSPQ